MKFAFANYCCAPPDNSSHDCWLAVVPFHWSADDGPTSHNIAVAVCSHWVDQRLDLIGIRGTLKTFMFREAITMCWFCFYLTKISFYLNFLVTFLFYVCFNFFPFTCSAYDSTDAKYSWWILMDVHPMCTVHHILVPPTPQLCSVVLDMIQCVDTVC